MSLKKTTNKNPYLSILLQTLKNVLKLAGVAVHVLTLSVVHTPLLPALGGTGSKTPSLRTARATQ